MEQGAMSTGFFIILSGTVEVRIPDSVGGHESRFLCDADVHNYFGEVSLLGENRTVSASVVAAQECMLLHLTPQAFLRFLAFIDDDVDPSKSTAPKRQKLESDAHASKFGSGTTTYSTHQHSAEKPTLKHVKSEETKHDLVKNSQREKLKLQQKVSQKKRI